MVYFVVSFFFSAHIHQTLKNRFWLDKNARIFHSILNTKVVVFEFFFDTSRIGIWGKSHDFDIREIVKNIEPTHVDLELNKKFKSLKNDI